MLHDVTEQTMRDHMDRYVGPKWEQCYDRLAATREQQRAVTEQSADGVLVADDGRLWPVWGGVRRTTEDTSAAGYYRQLPGKKDGETTLEFRPLIQELDHDLADAIGDVFATHLRAYPDPELKQLKELARQYEAKIFGESGAGPEIQIEPDHEPEISLDL